MFPLFRPLYSLPSGSLCVITVFVRVRVPARKRALEEQDNEQTSAPPLLVQVSWARGTGFPLGRHFTASEEYTELHHHDNCWTHTHTHLSHLHPKKRLELAVFRLLYEVRPSVTAPKTFTLLELVIGTGVDCPDPNIWRPNVSHLRVKEKVTVTNNLHLPTQSFLFQCSFCPGGHTHS